MNGIVKIIYIYKTIFSTSLASWGTISLRVGADWNIIFV